MGYITYKMKNYSKEFLQKNKFRYNGFLSDYEDEVYTYMFPVCTYRNIVTIECEISVSAMTGAVNVNVYNAGMKELYAAYYNRKFGKCEIIKSIDTKINRILAELEIEKQELLPVKKWR